MALLKYKGSLLLPYILQKIFANSLHFLEKCVLIVENINDSGI